ncbi:hypothetical protein PAAG_00470 [Paracoccidioides lutzii Pb01]|uniref:Fungal-type protein kinase domain-containing protein n=1 Tax=Paracoccidioides lutzii (strain ATCC MYA-826 / Pb01) TaxID=502779 RepID=C1GPM5_PARBA|nr:hypothetical protein PAAG_00470 [Paracoccidioides lutzii Pb01]EEH36147.2 hypothetical protein PAAG_00470 [Paracoccidioides lutzii Pb01]
MSGNLYLPSLTPSLDEQLLRRASPPSFDGTPVKSTSSSQKGSEQTRELVNLRIFKEIHGCTFRDVEGFFDKYFEEKDWSGKADAICQRVLAPDSDGNWAQFPNPPTQDNVLTWWFRLQEDLLSESRGTYYTTVSKADLTSSKAERQVDLLLRARGANPSQKNHDCGDILVVGELNKSKEEIRTKGTLLQMSRYVREVFAAQPTRRFVHAFAVCGTKMEAWAFDRSGPYSSGIIDVDSRRFFQVLVGYTMMSDEELGLDTFIARDEDGNKSITVKGPGNSEGKKVRLGEMLSCQCAIVCRGTTCFLTNDGQVDGVAKISWVSNKRRPEAELLELAGQKNVQGVARIIGHSTITSIADMCCGLTFDDKRHDFKSAPSSTASSFHQSQLLAKPCHLDIRRKSSSRKRRSPDERLQASKRSHSISQPSRDTQEENKLAFSIQLAHKPSLFDRNVTLRASHSASRCNTRAPVSLPGWERPSSGYFGEQYNNNKSRQGGRSLRHANRSGSCQRSWEGAKSGARHQTGTMEFMAIEVLFNIDQTYRHDLESFFYVLIWQCARHGWEKLKQLQKLYQLRVWSEDSMLKKWCTESHEKIENLNQGNTETGEFERILKNEFSPPKDSMLKEWYTGTYKKIARIKRTDMDADGLEDILTEFPPAFEFAKPLCTALRDILFPYRVRGIIVGTPQDPNRIYNPIIKAYDDAISLIGCQSN